MSKKITLTFLCLLFTSVVLAESPEQQTQQIVNQIVDQANKNHCDQIASWINVSHSKPTVGNYKITDDKLKIDSVCQSVREFSGGKKPKFEKFEEQSKGSDTYYLEYVKFGKVSKMFAFIKFQEQLLLVDID